MLRIDPGVRRLDLLAVHRDAPRADPLAGFRARAQTGLRQIRDRVSSCVGVVGNPYDRTVIECVPNFSEGRDAAVVRAIADAIAATPGVLLLGAESDADHNRSVMTFAGSPDAVVEAAVRGAGKAAELIDLSAHQGVHPRVGAADVIPFVPLDGSTMDEAVAAAHRAGEEIWRRFGVPVYFYEHAARSPARRRLEKVRKREFDGAPPDIGTIGGASHRGRVDGRGARIPDRLQRPARDARRRRRAGYRPQDSRVLRRISAT